MRRQLDQPTHPQCRSRSFIRPLVLAVITLSNWQLSSASLPVAVFFVHYFSPTAVMIFPNHIIGYEIHTARL
jgi:hypothetical protein